MSRAVMFEDTRSYIVKDDAVASDGVTAIPPQRVIQLNAPNNMFPDALAARQGTWTPSDYGKKTEEMPSIATWVTAADGTGAGAYRMASASSTQVTVTCVPINEEAGVDKKAYQAVTKLIARKTTKLEDSTQWFGIGPGTGFNVDEMSRQPYTRSQTMYRGETSKGATITTNYSFKRMNSGPARSSLNHWFTDKAPVELDYLTLSIMPSNTSYGSASAPERCGIYRVVIKVKCIVNLSEPNTNTVVNTSIGEGAGKAFQSAKRSAQEMFGGGSQATQES